jgi:hypothetical protein
MSVIARRLQGILGSEKRDCNVVAFWLDSGYDMIDSCAFNLN